MRETRRSKQVAVRVLAAERRVDVATPLVVLLILIPALPALQSRIQAHPSLGTPGEVSPHQTHRSSPARRGLGRDAAELVVTAEVPGPPPKQVAIRQSLPMPVTLHSNLANPISVSWEARLKEAAASFVTSSPDETAQLAHSLDFMAADNEHPSNMCGPLAAAILRDAGLLPVAAGPVRDLRSYWLANPLTNGRPWSLFPNAEYDLYRFGTNIHRFDFGEWPLRAGDFVFTYAGSGSFSHMFVVSEIDEAGRAFTVTNMLLSDGNYVVARVLLYDAVDGRPGPFEASCNDCVGWKRQTGLGGFDVLRGIELPPVREQARAPSRALLVRSW